MCYIKRVAGNPKELTNTETLPAPQPATAGGVSHTKGEISWLIKK